MKSADTWLEILSTLAHGIFCKCDQCRRGMERYITPQNIQQIQLDAMKEGARRAAERVRQRKVAERYVTDRNWNTMQEDSAQAILTTAEQWTEKDLL